MDLWCGPSPILNTSYLHNSYGVGTLHSSILLCLLHGWLSPGPGTGDTAGYAAWRVLEMRGRIFILSRKVRKSLSEKVKMEQRPEGRRRGSYVGIQGKSGPGRGNSQGKGGR